MSHVVDWDAAAVEWTVSGYELSLPLAAQATARQVKIVADAVEQALGRVRGDELSVTHVDAEGDAGGEVLITATTLLAVDPRMLRAVVDQAADAAANAVAIEEQRDAPIIASWLAAVRSSG